MSKDLNMIKNERIVYLMIITLLVLILAYTVLMNGNEGEKKRLLTESEAVLRKEIGQLDKVIQEKQKEVNGLTSNNGKQRKKMEEVINQLKNLKGEKEKLLKNVQTLKRDHNINLKRITDLNAKIVQLRKDVANVKEKNSSIPRTAVDSSVLLVLDELKSENAKLESEKTYLSKKVTDLETKISSSLPVHVEMAAAFPAKKKKVKQVSITFIVLPNKAREQANTKIDIYHLRYRYNEQKKDTEIERVFITSLAYKKKRMEKTFVYKPKKAFEAGTHVFEASAGGEVLGSKTLSFGK